jgi:hypothetical protein
MRVRIVLILGGHISFVFFWCSWLYGVSLANGMMLDAVMRLSFDSDLESVSSKNYILEDHWIRGFVGHFQLDLY